MNMPVSDTYRRSSHILLGVENMYPEKELISKMRFALETLTFHKEDAAKVVDDLLVILKTLKKYPATPFIENLVKAENSKQLFEAVLALIDHLSYAAMFDDIRLISSHFSLVEDNESLKNLVVRLLNDLKENKDYWFCKDVVAIILEPNPFVKCKKILNFYEFLYDDESIAQLRKALDHYVSLDSEDQLYSFLHQNLEIPLLNNIKNLGDFPGRDRLIESMSKGQVKSKVWAIETLNGLKLDLQTGLVLCGWFGVLPYLMFENGFDSIVSVDIDDGCETVAKRINKWHFDKSKFQAMTKDIFAIDYNNIETSFKFIEHIQLKPDIIVNTSCEHIDNFNEWYDKIPEGQLMLLQSNDFFDCDEHVNCVNSTAEFREQTPMTKRLFSGALPLEKYTRYMVVGYK